MADSIGVVIVKNQGGYIAYCPSIKNCETNGDSLVEVMSSIKVAAEKQLEKLTPEQRALAFELEVLTTTIDLDIS